MSPLSVDRAAIEAFVAAVFPYADEGSYVQLRAFVDRADGGTWGDWPVVRLNGGGLGPLVDTASQFAQECANAVEPVVFCPPIVTLKSDTSAAEKDISNGVVLSVECDARAEAARDLLERVLGRATIVVASGGETVCPRSGLVSPRLHLHWRLQEPTRDFGDHIRLKEARRLAQQLVGADGSAVPLVHPLRWPGSWHRKGEPRLARIVSLNEDAELDLREALERLKEAVADSGGDPDAADYTTHQSGDPQADPLDVAAALAVLPNADLEWSKWNKVGMATWRATGGGASGLAAFLAWSEKSGKYNESDVRERWRHYFTSPPTQIGAGTLFYMAAQARPGWQKPTSFFFIPSGDSFADYGNGHWPGGEAPPAEGEDFNAGDTADATNALSVDADDWAEADLPRRPWVARGHALRGAVTVVAGPPSAAKSSLMLAWACATALGRRHGPFAPEAAAPVLVFNVEDDATEQRRRLSAVLRQFNAIPADIKDKVIRASPAGIGTLFVLDDKGKVSPTAVMFHLRRLIAEHQPAMLIADPFAELHTAEENDNTAVRAIIAAFRSIAVEFNIAVVLVHHTRKGGVAPGDPDSARGASAIIGAARVVLTMVGMSEDDAEALGVSTSRRTRSLYVRLDDAKQNYAEIGDAVWYEKVLYRIENGEFIPAAEPWAPPDMWDAIPTHVANAILDDIEAGIDAEKGKQYYTDAPRGGDRAAWSVVTKRIPSLSEKQARVVIKTWVDNKVLFCKSYDDPVERKPRNGLFVNAANRPGPKSAR